MTEDQIPAGTPVAPAEAATCATCLKPATLCVCDAVSPFDHRIGLLILQHPQEQDKSLGTARLTALHFRKSVFKVGLSWASLIKALGRSADPGKWATLYLGSAEAGLAIPRGEIAILDSKGAPLAHQEIARNDIEGIILLDGTWSQAKALWWRNPWLLKGKRVILNPAKPSLYGSLRREPRREGLSTIEAAGLVLARLEGRPEIETALLESFERMLARYRSANPAATGPARGGETGPRRRRRR